jgi:phage baseplate assembly protein V
MIEHEDIHNHRVLVTRGVVGTILDNGLVQTADVTTHDGVTRGAVEVFHMFGVTSVAPANGSTIVLLANGGDESDMIGLPVACAWARLGGLLAGETAIYGVDGTRIHIKQGGIVQVLAAAAVDITAPTCTITCSGGITLAANVTITGNLAVDGNASIGGALSVTGNISAGGNITAGGTISGH